MLKRSLYTTENNTTKKNLYTIKKKRLQKDNGNIDDAIFRGGAHTQQDFKQ